MKMAKVSDKHFVLEKITKYLQEDIAPSRYTGQVTIENWQLAEYHSECAPHSIADFKNIPDQNFKPIGQNDRWGGKDRTAWFKTTITVPESFKNCTEKVGLRIICGISERGRYSTESLLYVNGKAVQGFDPNHSEAFLDPRFLESGKLDIAVKAWCGLNTSLKVMGETTMFRHHQITDEFYFLAKTVCEMVPLLGENDLRRIKLHRLLQDTFKEIDFLHYRKPEYYHSIENALSFLREGLAKLRNPEVKPTIHAVGHSHIDMAWWWRICHTREKASRTFATVLNLMRQYPDYYFMHSSPQLYKFLEEDHPETFAQIKQKVAEGQWEATGGMWVEADTNVTSGESLVRQFLYGMRYFKNTFGQYSKVLWLPDVFGYSAALPQIAKKAGIESFMTTKISWNQYNHFPHDTFLWRGIDGTELFTHFITTSSNSWFYTYNGLLDAKEIPGIWQNYKQKELNSDLLLSYGYGDGGGGPTREMLEARRAMEDIPGIPYVKPNKVEPYFEALTKTLQNETLEVYDGELYFEFHRGTYTSQAYSKKANRRIENMLRNLEFIRILGDKLSGTNTYPKAKLDEIWERVLLLQFHDIIPGTSINEVYKDSRADYEKMFVDCDNLLAEGVNTINDTLQLNQNSIVVYNTLSWVRDALVFVPFSELVSDNTAFMDGEKQMTSQKADGGLLVCFENLPPMGYKSFAISTAKNENKYDTQASATKVETPYYIARLNDKGEFTSLYDKLQRREIGKSNLNVLEAFEDKPLRYDAWDIDVFYKEKPYAEYFTCKSVEVVEQGALQTVLRRKLTFNSSSDICQDIIFYENNPRIDFKTFVNWNESQVLLKVAFPLNIRTTTVRYDIQFGHIERSNHSNDVTDFAQFEVCGHKWADVSESGYGVALLNDCKYGYDCKDSVLRLSLIKSPISPDPVADRGEYSFTYALYPHLGSHINSDVAQEATALNVPALAYEVRKAGRTPFVTSSMFKLVYSYGLEVYANIIIDTVKRAEDDDSMIIRIVEISNCLENDVYLLFNDALDITGVEEVNLLEETLQACEIVSPCMDVDDYIGYSRAVKFDISSFEIKSFKIMF